MRVSPIKNSPCFNSKHSENTQNANPIKTHKTNPVAITGYTSIAAMGAAMVSGINHSMKLHKASCYIALAAAASHIAILTTHKHSHEKSNV